MAYGILKENINTGGDDELSVLFATPMTIVSNRPEAVSTTFNLRQVGSIRGYQRWEVTAELGERRDGVDFFHTIIQSGRSSVIYVRMPQLMRESNIIQIKHTNVLSVRNDVLIGNYIVDVVNGDELRIGEYVKFGSHPDTYEIIARSSTQIRLRTPLGRTIIAGEVVHPNGVITGHEDNFDPNCRVAANAVVGRNTLTIVAGDRLRRGDFIQFANHTKIYNILDQSTAMIRVFPNLIAPVGIGEQIKTGKRVTLNCKISIENVPGITYENGILMKGGSYTFVEAL